MMYNPNPNPNPNPTLTLTLARSVEQGDRQHDVQPVGQAHQGLLQAEEGQLRHDQGQ